MIQINALPELDWTEQSAKEIARSPTIVEDSDFAYQLGDWFVGGWKYPSFVGPPWFWFALSKQAGVGQLRRLKVLQPMMPADLHTAVLRGWTVGDKFAKWFGFKPTDEVMDIEGEEYLVYRRD